MTAVSRLGALHRAMLEAVLGGDLDAMAALAAKELGGTVAVVVPSAGLAVAAPPIGPPALAALRRYAGQRLAGEPAAVPDGFALELPVRTVEVTAGLVLLLDAPDGDAAARDAEAAGDVLLLAATSTIVAMALDAAPEDRRRVGESLLADLLDGVEGVDVLGRAHRAGSDLSRGAIAACVVRAAGYAHRVDAAVRDAFPTALVLQRGDRVDALLPGGDRESALAVARRLEPVATLALAPFEPEPDRLGRALREAAYAAAVLERGAATADEVADGTYRLLLRLASEHLAELARFDAATIGAVADYDAHHGTDILGTLVAYLENDCNMNATAAAIYAHRHTVAYRLERVHELTGLDPLRREGRERLGLGLKTAALLAA
jgi:hypothetical protein